ncbi:DNA-3-methyladenine glycosylase [Spelaeicoccus albus]|nr:DNA-3-methyladenine glycosylase [Spelaeicoccus albus]
MRSDLLTLLSGDVVDVAPTLLGCVIGHRNADGYVGVRLTEVEAYKGELDPGSHSYRGKTARNSSMFGPAGTLYVYFTYGMHHCVNLVCGDSDSSRGALLRAGEVVDGVDLATSRRSGRRRSPAPFRSLARGPACVAQALGLTLANDGESVFDDDWSFDLPPQPIDAGRIRSGPRVGLRGPGGDGDQYPWRFWLDGDPTVSAYKPAAALKPRR